MTTFTEVRLNAEQYGYDVQFRMQCPVCDNKERSFAAVMQATGEIKYMCHRAKCGTKGMLKSVGVPSEKLGTKEKKPTRELNLRELTDNERNKYRKLWGTCPYTWRVDENTKRLAMPVLGPQTQIRGFALRSSSIIKDLIGEPKVLSVRTDYDNPFVHWRLSETATGKAIPRVAMIVEDIPSSYRVSSYRHGIALMGTHIQQDVLTEITNSPLVRKEEIIIALDEDASVKALQYQKELGAYFTRVKVMLLTKDLKDMSELEVATCLNAI